MYSGNKENGFSIILVIILFLIIISVVSLIFIRKPIVTIPRCYISSTTEKNIYVKDQSIILRASCDNQLETNGAVFKWESNLDGVLGTEKELFVKATQLKEGVHIITFSWQLNGKTLGSASIDIEIRRERGFFNPEFSVAPDWFYIDSSRDADNHSISVRNDGDGELGWVLEFSKPWIHSTMLKGTAPSDFTISVDFNSVNPGYYREKAIFRSTSLNLEKVVPISVCHNPNEDEKINDKCYPLIMY